MTTFRTLIIAAFTILLPAATSPARAEKRRLMQAAPVSNGKISRASTPENANSLRLMRMG